LNESRYPCARYIPDATGSPSPPSSPSPTSEPSQLAASQARDAPFKMDQTQQPYETPSPFLQGYINRTLRVTTTDDRFFIGDLKCTDRVGLPTCSIYQKFERTPWCLPHTALLCLREERPEEDKLLSRPAAWVDFTDFTHFPDFTDFASPANTTSRIVT
jgi:hypothetical protein